MNTKTLSVVLATKNEEENLSRCLESIKSIADEIVIFDEYSTDKTIEIAKKYGAKVYSFRHTNNFHETKQKAIEKAKSDWILQLDADEVASDGLAQEIKKVINMPQEQLETRIVNKLFLRHQKVVEERDGKIGSKDPSVVAFFIPRRNLFIGKALIHAGVYPDAVIRLFKKGRAYLPARSVHEQMVIDGQVSWLTHDLLHYDSPTITRYLARLNRYTDERMKYLQETKVPKNIISFFKYTFVLPSFTFLKLYFRHAGFKDGLRGFLWSVFSSFHYPLAYFKYSTS